MIGNKQRSSNQDWLDALANIESLVSFEEIKALEKQAIKFIRQVLSNYSRIGYGWSGGKDSLVLERLLKKSGVPLVGGVFVQYQNEYPEFLEYINQHKPDDVTVWEIDNYTDAYLNKNPNMLFPIETKDKTAYLPPRWKAQTRYAMQNAIEVMVFGRRRKDGNICGNEKDNFVVSAGYYHKFNPIALWTHEQVLAYLHYNNIPLPSIYYYPNGFMFGTHVWTDRRRIDKDYNKTFDEIMAIDPSILPNKRGINLVDDYFKLRGGN